MVEFTVVFNVVTPDWRFLSAFVGLIAFIASFFTIGDKLAI